MENQIKKIDWWEMIKRAFFVIVFAQIILALVPKAKKTILDMQNPKTKVAMIELKGNICDSKQVVKEVRHAYDKDIKACILKIDSGGGAAGSSEALCKEISRLNQKKPVIALIENVCASGAYLAACGASSILAQRMSSVGHVGVLMILPNIKKFLENHKVDVHTPHAGEYKTAGSMFMDSFDDKSQKYIDGLLKKSYESFVDIVAKKRNLDPKKHKDWANGKIFSGDDALKMGLIDQIGDLGDAEENIRKILNKPDAEIEFVRYPKPSPLNAFLTSQQQDEDLPESLPLSFFSFLLDFAKNSFNFNLKTF